MVLDLIIIGVGPAGLTASIYAKRACLNFEIFADPYSINSQICSTYEVCNYPGINNVSGEELYKKFSSHAKELGVTINNEKVIEIFDENEKIKKVKTNKAIYETKTILLATGTIPKKIGLINEDKFVGSGVSYCATCDGAFFNGKTVAVVGGGDVAVEDAIFLSRNCNKVYLIVRKGILRATPTLQKELFSKNNVEILYNTNITDIIGEEKFEGIYIKSENDIVSSEFSIDGLFIGIGSKPSSDLLLNKIDMENGFIVAGEDCKTSISGIFVAGDVRKKQLRQVVTACADGANAVISIQKFLIENADEK